SADAYRLLAPANATAGRTESFQVEESDGERPSSAEFRDLFAGLDAAPGTEARRLLAPIDETNFDQKQRLAQQQRNFAAYAERMLDDPRFAAQLIGQTKDIISGAPPAQAALQLFHLAEEYRRQ